jgi:hypothetical protein
MNPLDDKSISALESCRAAEDKIQEAQEFLLTAGPQGPERCLNGLEQAAEILEAVISSGPFPQKNAAGQNYGKPALAAAIRRIQRSARLLRLQIVFASNFWKGWLQRQEVAGYTNQGLPVFADRSARSFEG